MHKIINNKILIFTLLSLFSLTMYSQEVNDSKDSMIVDDFTGQEMNAEEYFDKWINEYVKWIILSDEEDQFENLENIQQKLDFIQLFWLKRDPYLDTLYNEFKEEYYNRLRYIYSNFGFGDTPGILSDRGMVYAVLGTPSYVERNFTVSDRALGRGDTFARRGQWWAYVDQPGLNIPTAYYILFLRFGANRYDIVYDLWGYGSKPYIDRLLDQGSYGRRGFIPNRLRNLMQEKKEWLVRNDDIEDLKKKMAGPNIHDLSSGNVDCKFSWDEDEKGGNLKCGIKYLDIIFRVENSKNITNLTGSIVLQRMGSDPMKKYILEPVNLKISDEELKEKFNNSLEFETTIEEIPDEKGIYLLILEIKDIKSGAVYTSKTSVERD